MKKRLVIFFFLLASQVLYGQSTKLITLNDVERPGVPARIAMVKDFINNIG